MAKSPSAGAAGDGRASVRRGLLSGLPVLGLAVVACTAPQAPQSTGQPSPAQSAPAPAAQPAKPATQPAAKTDLRSLSGNVRLDGSSTVFPVSEAMAEEFQKATGNRVRVTVGISGSGGGFKKFCNDETDVSNASRPISASEIAACKEKGIQFIELPVAFDGLSVVVSPRNTFVDCMKVSELKKMWEPGAQGTVSRWNQVRSGWPDRSFKLYGPGPDSGTFDYFTEAINGKEKASRGDFAASEDDNILVQGVANDADALGYFGYAYYVENPGKLKPVKIDAEKGGGCVAPSPATIANGSYQPLSRPLFIYVKLAAIERPEVRELVRFYLNTQNANTLIKEVGYIQFPERIYETALKRFEAKQVGTVFGGQSRQGATIDDLVGTAPRTP